MTLKTLIIISTVWLSTLLSYGNNINCLREVITLKKDWKFIHKEVENAQAITFNDSLWETVRVPHDWAIYGPFDKTNDAQVVMVTEDGEDLARLRTGRTGGLPHMGVGWYRKTFDVPLRAEGKKLFVEFDGAMSNAKVYFNGTYIGEWPYGYSSFNFDLTDHVKTGQKNVLAVRLENFTDASRWYPGAGLYRNVRLVYTPQIHIAHWGTYITTPNIAEGKGTVNIRTTIKGKGAVRLITEIVDDKGRKLASNEEALNIDGEVIAKQKLEVKQAVLWSIEVPRIYNVISKLIADGKVIDSYESTFGFRYYKFTADDGFHLNGKRVQINGVCMHHDLGAIGTAVNNSAIYRQLRILKELGCNAIRMSHNPPSPEYLYMCDTMGFIVMDEIFDEWKIAKVTNGYNKLWDKWHVKDLTAMIHRDRNHPSVIMWGVGNEIREQYEDDSWKITKSLVDICHKEDPTRPVGMALNKYNPVENDFAAQLDVKSWNYRFDYARAHKEHPDWAFFASETQSTVSSRGYYDTDAILRRGGQCRRENMYCSSYSLEYANWGNIPDKGFATLDDNPFIAGEFVWTGFDYLGEPSPYNLPWPSRSSYFGIVDLAGLPKDLFYMYQSRWTDNDVLHILPHWNWNKGDTIPIHVFTNYNSAELFVNGKSYGVQTRNPEELLRRYRLVWDSVVYKPGTVKVVAIPTECKPAKETIIETAGEPYGINLILDEGPINANGEDLAYIEVQVVDEKGRVCPLADNIIYFEVKGKGTFRAADNGAQSDLEPFHSQKRRCFNGKCIAIVQTNEEAGEIKLIASSNNLKSNELKILSY